MSDSSPTIAISLRGSATNNNGGDAKAAVMKSAAASDRASSSEYAEVQFGDVGNDNNNKNRHYESTSAMHGRANFNYDHIDAGFVNMSELEAESARL